MIRDDAGTLYGTTCQGGAFERGTVYKLEASGRFTVLHSFTGSDGSNPAGVIRDDAGTLYGATSGGTVGRYPGVRVLPGTVYKLEASGTFTVLHSFTDSDGIHPIFGVVRDSAGDLYGTTAGGGAFGGGTVYKLEASGRFTVLHSFDSSDGVQPWAGVIQDSAGTLYSTTSQGGAFGFGTVYKLDASGTFTVLHSFTGPAFSFPTAVIMDNAGNLYGATNGGAAGAGTVYKLDVSGTFTVLHSFTGSDGTNPMAVIMDSAGNLYGVTLNYGPGGGGVVYRLTLASAALDCSAATASVDFPRLGNRHRYPVTISGVTVPPDDNVSITITSIFQDEPVTNPTGKTCPDGVGVGTAVAKVRNERIITSAGDGRVYHVGFTATDEAGASCTEAVQVCVPVNEGEECGDQGALFDSTVCP